MQTYNMQPKNRSLKLAEKQYFFNSLSMYVRASIPLVEALELISSKSTSSNVKAIAKELCKYIKSGMPFADVIPLYEHSFGSVISKLLIVGEKSGKLDYIIPQIQALLNRESDTRSKIVSAMIYPAILLFLTLVVVLLFVYFINPVLLSLKAGLTVNMLSLIQSAVIKIFVTLFAILVAIVALFKIIQKSDVLNKVIIPFCIKLPYVGDFIRDIYLTNFLLALKVSYEAGIPVASAFELAVQTVTLI